MAFVALITGLTELRSPRRDLVTIGMALAGLTLAVDLFLTCWACWAWLNWHGC